MNDLKSITICGTEIQLNSHGFHLEQEYYYVFAMFKGYMHPKRLRFRNITDLRSFGSEIQVYAWNMDGNGNLYSFNLSEIIKCEPCEYGKMAVGGA